MLNLPDELILMIFSYLSYNEVLNVAGVSRRCYSIAHDKSLWRRFKIGENFTKIRGSKFKKIIAKHPEISYVNFYSIHKTTIKTKIVEKLTEIKSLIVDDDCPEESILKILTNNNITHLDIRYDIGGADEQYSGIYNRIDELCPNLEILAIRSCNTKIFKGINKLTKLKSLEIFSALIINNLTIISESITCLDISFWEKDVQFPIYIDLPNLTELNNSRCDVTINFNVPRLTKLIGCHNIKLDNMHNYPYLSHLELISVNISSPLLLQLAQFNLHTLIFMYDSRSHPYEKVGERDLSLINSMNLTCLEIIGCKLTDSELTTITKYIEKINLSGNNLTGEVIPNTNNLTISYNIIEMGIINRTIDTLTINSNNLSREVLLEGNNINKLTMLDFTKTKPSIVNNNINAFHTNIRPNNCILENLYANNNIKVYVNGKLVQRPTII